MRYIKDIRNSRYKIGLYQWNGKYIIKVEADGMLEQIYKIDETDLSSADDIDVLLDSEFILTMSHRFQQMNADMQASLDRNGLIY